MSVKTESVQVQKTPVQRRHIDTIDNLISIGREAVLPYLGTRVVLVLVGLLADFYILPMIKSDPILPLAATNTQFPSALWLIWQRFDSGFYLGIAINGYWPASTLHTYPSLVVSGFLRWPGSSYTGTGSSTVDTRAVGILAGAQ